jgi:hypothetical protein
MAQCWRGGQQIGDSIDQLVSSVIRPGQVR